MFLWLLCREPVVLMRANQKKELPMKRYSAVFRRLDKIVPAPPPATQDALRQMKHTTRPTFRLLDDQAARGLLTRNTVRDTCLSDRQSTAIPCLSDRRFCPGPRPRDLSGQQRNGNM